jgi:hypothetical protein
MGGPEVKSDQLTWNGSELSRSAALRIASAPVPFWSPTFSVTEDRLAELDGDELAAVEAAGEAEDAADEELELLDEEQAATPRPATAMTENARIFRLGFIYILLFRWFLREIVGAERPGTAPRPGLDQLAGVADGHAELAQ